jgi:hypothetical protein
VIRGGDKRFILRTGSELTRRGVEAPVLEGGAGVMTKEGGGLDETEEAGIVVCDKSGTHLSSRSVVAPLGRPCNVVRVLRPFPC